MQSKNQLLLEQKTIKKQMKKQQINDNKETEIVLSVLKDLDSLKSFQETVEENSLTWRKL